MSMKGKIIKERERHIEKKTYEEKYSWRIL
jgi:hypothetical protein